jgi:plastocyanin
MRNDHPDGPRARATPSPTVRRRWAGVKRVRNGLTFEPNVVTVPVGSTVTWANQGSAPHTVTGEGFDSGNDPSTWIMGGGSFSFTFTAPGTYNYVCVPHEALGMAGTIVVQ